MAEKNNPPVLTTLCYLERDGKYLMLHRTKKEHDINKDKYIGIGGHFEFGESPDECLVREAKEETGLTLTSYRARGIVTFIYGIGSEPICEYMHLYTADGWKSGSGNVGTTESSKLSEPKILPDCSEGDLVWIDKKDVYDLPIWEGDRIFFRLLEEDRDFFSLKLVYSEDGDLKEAILDGQRLSINRMHALG